MADYRQLAGALTNEDYYQLLTEAVDKLALENKLDYKDYIKRVLKEALKVGSK